MTRKDLIEDIAIALANNGVLDTSNYTDELDQLEDVQNIIHKALDGYVLVKGEVI